VKYYELTYLTSPELSEEKLNSLRERVISYLQERKGILSEAGNSIKKILGYPIKKKKSPLFTHSAFLATLDFSAPPDLIDDLKKRLDGEPEILRYFIIGKKTPAKAAAPPIPEKFKRERAEIKKPTVRTQPKEPKVELEEIEKKLDEILGE